MNFLKDKGMFVVLIIVVVSITLIGANRSVHLENQTNNELVMSK